MNPIKIHIFIFILFWRISLLFHSKSATPTPKLLKSNFVNTSMNWWRVETDNGFVYPRQYNLFPIQWWACILIVENCMIKQGSLNELMINKSPRTSHSYDKLLYFYRGSHKPSRYFNKYCLCKVNWGLELRHFGNFKTRHGINFFLQ